MKDVKLTTHLHPVPTLIMSANKPLLLPDPVTVRSKAHVRGRLCTGITGSNLTEGMDVRLACCCVLCRQRPLRRADQSFRGVLLCVCVCVCMCVCVSVCLSVSVCVSFFILLSISMFHYMVIQGGSNMTGTDLCVNKPHCAAAVRP